jgi:1-aminocyclopropane-1-carboxylate deaminase/D-cysteine desulfhydrase-like pyridoxal-dependent ACC family enzyme
MEQLSLDMALKPAEHLTPVEQRGDVYVKRDDLYSAAGAPGGKARTCLRLQRAGSPEAALVTAGSRGSPQVHIVALVANHASVPCRVHVPAAKGSYPELDAARELGAEVIEHRPGYNSVIKGRARMDAETTGATHIPFGMECWEAVEETAAQAYNLPYRANRIVVPVGSGMSLAGVLMGLRYYFINPVPVLGVVVGANPTKRLDKYAPWWRHMCELVPAGTDYARPAEQTNWWGIELDPHYEAKAAPFVRPGDLFWCVGIRPRLGGSE